MGKLELFDIYDEHQVWKGTAERQDVHQNGWWHQTFHCWIVSERDGRLCLLYQRRHMGKDTYPGLLDISCAGHLEAGETITDGIRELQEELGLAVNFEDLSSCGMIAEEYPLPKGGMDREFSHVFYLRNDQPLEDYQVQLEEVIGLYWVACEDIVALIEQQVSSIPILGIEIDDNGNCSLQTEQRVGLEKFVPHSLQYYKLLFDALGA